MNRSINYAITTLLNSIIIKAQYITFYPEYERFDSFCDTMPLIIYYDGITPELIDAEGRNSLDLAPTILDYLNIDSPNYFLGTFLFLPMRNPELETTFCVPDSNWLVRTNEGIPKKPTEAEANEIMSVIERYLSITRQTDSPIP